MMRQRRQRSLGQGDPRTPTRKRQGLTRLAVDELFARQGGRCIFGEPLGPDFAGDHDHRLPPWHPHPVPEPFERAFGFPPMPHQVAYLEETRPTVVLKGRQVGMTHAAAGLAVHTARSEAGSTSVIISPSLRQSSEVTARARLALWEWG